MLQQKKSIGSVAEEGSVAMESGAIEYISVLGPLLVLMSLTYNNMWPYITAPPFVKA